MSLERYTLFNAQTFTTGTAAATTWVTPAITLNNAAAWLYGHIRCKSGGTLSVTGTLSAVQAIVQYRETWGTLTMSPGQFHQMSFSAKEVIGTTLSDGALFSLLPGVDDYGVFASEEPTLPIFSVKFAFTKPAGVAETMQFDCDAYVEHNDVPDNIGTLAPQKLLSAAQVS